MKLEEIAPLWAEALKIYKTEGYEKYVEFCKKRDLRINNGTRCIIGEAWGWNVKYMYWEPMTPAGKEMERTKQIGCLTCNDISARFLHVFKARDGTENEYKSGYEVEPKPGHEQVVETLEKHWCEKHSK
jgi:hypothetical protein